MSEELYIQLSKEEDEHLNKHFDKMLDKHGSDHGYYSLPSYKQGIIRGLLRLMFKLGAKYERVMTAISHHEDIEPLDIPNVFEYVGKYPILDSRIPTSNTRSKKYRKSQLTKYECSRTSIDIVNGLIDRFISGDIISANDDLTMILLSKGRYKTIAHNLDLPYNYVAMHTAHTKSTVSPNIFLILKELKKHLILEINERN